MTSKCVFDYICVIDFEATCVPGCPRDFYPHEIIEFPAFLIDVNKCEIVNSFHSFVRPILNPELSDFCKRLTGINQESVNEAETFQYVLLKFEEWIFNIVTAEQSFVVLTDGSWDIIKFLNLQCVISHADFPSWAIECIDIKKTFETCNHILYKMRLLDMLSFYGLSFQGRLHSGKDDAYNIAQLVLFMLRKGCNLKANSYFSGSSSNDVKEELSAYLRMRKSKDKNRKKKKRTRKVNEFKNLSEHHVDAEMDVDPDLIGCESILMKYKDM